MRIFLIVIAGLLLAAGPAQAQDPLEHAAETLKLDPVYVAPDAERGISDDDADDLRALISDEEAGPLYIAVLPGSVADDAGGNPVAALRQIAEIVDEPGVYAAVIGQSFRAGAVDDDLSGARVGALAREAFESKRNAGTTAVLQDFVRRVGKARGSEGSETPVGDEGGAGGDDSGGGKGWIWLAVLAIPTALFGLSRWRRRRAAEAEFARVRKVARDDVIALGEEIRALDLDVELPDTDSQAKQHYDFAVESYQQAEQELERARRPEDLQPVAEQLESGRWEMEAARARMEGRTAPERRPPCFFDPRHGPSVKDVDWAPPGGEPREVPVCQADAVRLEEGRDPDTRMISVNGREVPYWEAGPAYGPFAGGFFAGGLVPGVLAVSLLEGDLFGGGGGGGDSGGGDSGDSGNFGDFGDDMGGGDFGGGDFGGGGDF